MSESKALKQSLIPVKNNEDVSQASKSLESEPYELPSSSNNKLIVKIEIKVSVVQSIAIES